MRNFYFSDKVRSEQNLYEDIIIESLKMYGQDVYYLPRDTVGEISELGDEVPARFNSSHKIEMYIENTEGFDGEGDLFTRFGVEIRDEATFVVARKRWLAQVKQFDSEVTAIRPLEGDLIFLPLTKKLFEITHVEHEQPFYQLSNLPVFKLRAQLYDYNDEDLDTGIEDIDTIEQDYAYTTLLVMSPADRTTEFKIGHTMQQTVGTAVMKGEISSWDPLTGRLGLIHVGSDDGKFHQLQAGSITYLENNTNHTVASVTEDIKQTANEQNDLFDAGNLSFLDFSEDNPFGDPND